VHYSSSEEEELSDESVQSGGEEEQKVEIQPLPKIEVTHFTRH
jgi:hypothetical protein